MASGAMHQQAVHEAELAAEGYTISVSQRAVLGRFQGTYFLRSAHRKIALPVEKTSLEQLAREWERFRSEALIP